MRLHLIAGFYLYNNRRQFFGGIFSTCEMCHIKHVTEALELNQSGVDMAAHAQPKRI